MRITYNKLIRDKIPDIIEATGKEFETAVYDDEGYRQALRQKLVEEAEEASKAVDKGEIIKEVADLYEVVDALLAFYDINPAQILEIQKQRKKERGAFQKRVQLLWVKESEIKI